MEYTVHVQRLGDRVWVGRYNALLPKGVEVKVTEGMEVPCSDFNTILACIYMHVHKSVEVCIDSTNVALLRQVATALELLKLDKCYLNREVTNLLADLDYAEALKEAKLNV